MALIQLVHLGCMMYGSFTGTSEPTSSTMLNKNAQGRSTSYPGEQFVFKIFYVVAMSFFRHFSTYSTYF